MRTALALTRLADALNRKHDNLVGTRWLDVLPKKVAAGKTRRPIGAGTLLASLGSVKLTQTDVISTAYRRRLWPLSAHRTAWTDPCHRLAPSVVCHHHRHPRLLRPLLPNRPLSGPWR